jgi:two-component system phosphate regulon response regulator PhoB
MSHLVLIVEDEKDLARSIEYNLGKEGYQTRCAYDGKTALEHARMSPHPDIVLLDLMLPDISGTEVCRELKSDSRTKHIPVIMVTAKGNEIDRVVGFELGADDYVVKPFSVRELMLRIKAVLRRALVADSEEQHIVFGKLKIDVPAHKVWVDNEEQELTALEFRLLETLYNRRGRVQTRDMLLSDVWGIDSDVTTRTVDTHIKRLREKLGECGKYIETIRGVGYRFMQEAGDDV